MTTTDIILIAVLILVGSAVLGLVIGRASRGLVQRRLYAGTGLQAWTPGTGLQAWTETAKQLSWSDRFHLAQANNRGRAAGPELAALGARRGRVMLAAVERNSTLRSSRRMRRFYRFWVVFAVLMMAFSVWVLTGDDTSWVKWVALAVWPVASALIAAEPWQQQRSAGGSNAPSTATRRWPHNKKGTPSRTMTRGSAVHVPAAPPVSSGEPGATDLHAGPGVAHGPRLRPPSGSGAARLSTRAGRHLHLPTAPWRL